MIEKRVNDLLDESNVVKETQWKVLTEIIRE